MHNRGRLFYLVALARSGKSTYAHEWVRTPQVVISDKGTRVLQPRVVISGDAFRLALTGQEYQALAECQVFASMDQAIRALLAEGYEVLIDETATTPETHKRYLRIDINAEPIFIDTPMEVCIQRALDTGKSFLVEPIKRMARNLASLKADWPRNFEAWKEEIRSRFHMDMMNTH